MAQRYIKIQTLEEAHKDEVICAVYEDALKNTSGLKDDGKILKAYEDSKEGKCRLVVWRDDDNKAYYQGLDAYGRIRDMEVSNCKILQFENKDKQDEGYTYFAKAVLDSLCEGEDGSGDYALLVEDNRGNVYPVFSAFLNRDDKTITLSL